MIRNLTEKQRVLREIWECSDSTIDSLIEKYFTRRAHVGHVSLPYLARVNKRQTSDILNHLGYTGRILSHCVESRTSWYVDLFHLPEVDEELAQFRGQPLLGGQRCCVANHHVGNCSLCIHHQFKTWPICLFHAGVYFSDLIHSHGEENGYGRFVQTLKAMQKVVLARSVTVDTATSALMVTRAQMKFCITTGRIRVGLIRGEQSVQSEQIWKELGGCYRHIKERIHKNEITPVNIRSYLPQLLRDTTI